jgi:glycopeptide antibiotics resistance protein
MFRFIRLIVALFVSVILSVGIIQFIAYPVLLNYPRFESVIERFAYTKETLILFLFLSLWLFYLQLEFRYFSAIYLYLFYSVYMFLLFVVLFTKAEEYRSFDSNLWGFLVRDKEILLQAILNVLYFIPLGALFSIKANWIEFPIVSLLIILGIETIQYVFYVGTFSYSDIMLNFIGCSIGYLTALGLKKYVLD